VVGWQWGAKLALVAAFTDILNQRLVTPALTGVKKDDDERAALVARTTPEVPQERSVHANPRLVHSHDPIADGEAFERYCDEQEREGVPRSVVGP